MRNIPRDDVLGSPTQRMLGRRTRTGLPTKDSLLKPDFVRSDRINQGLEEDRERQKWYFDRNTREIPKPKVGDAVRLHTKSGWQPAEMLKPFNKYSSVVKSGTEARE